MDERMFTHVSENPYKGHLSEEVVYRKIEEFQKGVVQYCLGLGIPLEPGKVEKYIQEVPEIFRDAENLRIFFESGLFEKMYGHVSTESLERESLREYEEGDVESEEDDDVGGYQESTLPSSMEAMREVNRKRLLLVSSMQEDSRDDLPDDVRRKQRILDTLQFAMMRVDMLRGFKEGGRGYGKELCKEFISFLKQAYQEENTKTLQEAVRLLIINPYRVSHRGEKPLEQNETLMSELSEGRMEPRFIQRNVNVNIEKYAKNFMDVLLGELA